MNMVSKPLLLGIVAVAVVIAGVLYLRRDAVPGLSGTPETSPAPTIHNSEMLASEGRFPITKESVNYFEDRQGYLAKPSQPGTYPGVVMIHENRGINEYVRAMADQLAKEGYVVLAVDLFGKSVATQEEARALTANFDQAVATQNLQTAVDYLRAQGVSKVASLGWCFGGAQSLQLAVSGTPLDATVVYYGRLITDSNQLDNIRWPVLGVFGNQDQSISVESVNQFDQALDALNIENEIYIYSGVGHAFANPSGMNYAAEPTKDAWAKTVSFLNKHLGNQ